MDLEEVIYFEWVEVKFGGGLDFVMCFFLVLKFYLD